MNAARLSWCCALFTALAARANVPSNGSGTFGRGTAINGAAVPINGGGTLLNGGGTLQNGGGTLLNGGGTLQNGGGTLLNGAGTLQNGGGTLQNGGGTLQNGAGVATGVTGLDAGNQSVTLDGTWTLLRGSGDFSSADGTVSGLTGTVVSLGGSVNNVSGGLTNGVGTLTNGGGTLLNGSGTLLNGGGTLQNGGGTLQNGGGTLQNGGGTLQNGGGTLQNGGGTLQNGGGTLQNGTLLFSALTGTFTNGTATVSLTGASGTLACTSCVLELTSGALSGLSGTLVLTNGDLTNLSGLLLNLSGTLSNLQANFVNGYDAWGNPVTNPYMDALENSLLFGNYVVHDAFINQSFTTKTLFDNGSCDPQGSQGKAWHEALFRIWQDPFSIMLLSYLWSDAHVLGDDLVFCPAEYQQSCVNGVPQLPPAPGVACTNPAHETIRFSGSIGLCDYDSVQSDVRTYNPYNALRPDATPGSNQGLGWAVDAPLVSDQRCQHWVSAVFLAQNNQAGIHNRFSARGPSDPTDPNSPQLIGTELNVPATQIPLLPYKYGTELPVEALMNVCPPDDLYNPAGFANCGWTPGMIGTCDTPDAPITISLKDGTNPHNSVLIAQVQQGVNGVDFPFSPGGDCVDGSGNPITPCVSEVLGYTQTPALTPSVTFACPQSGVFSVQWAPYFRIDAVAMGQTGVVPDFTATTSQGHVSYPADEIQIFPPKNLEAYFAGNIFGASNLQLDACRERVTLSTGDAEPVCPGVDPSDTTLCQATTKGCCVPCARCEQRPLGAPNNLICADYNTVTDGFYSGNECEKSNQACCVPCTPFRSVLPNPQPQVAAQDASRIATHMDHGGGALANTQVPAGVEFWNIVVNDTDKDFTVTQLQFQLANHVKAYPLSGMYERVIPIGSFQYPTLAWVEVWPTEQGALVDPNCATCAPSTGLVPKRGDGTTNALAYATYDSGSDTTTAEIYSQTTVCPINSTPDQCTSSPNSRPSQVQGSPETLDLSGSPSAMTLSNLPLVRMIDQDPNAAPQPLACAHGSCKETVFLSADGQGNPIQGVTIPSHGSIAVRVVMQGGRSQYCKTGDGSDPTAVFGGTGIAPLDMDNRVAVPRISVFYPDFCTQAPYTAAFCAANTTDPCCQLQTYCQSAIECLPVTASDSCASPDDVQVFLGRNGGVTMSDSGYWPGAMDCTQATPGGPEVCKTVNFKPYLIAGGYDPAGRQVLFPNAHVWISNQWGAGQDYYTSRSCSETAATGQSTCFAKYEGKIEDMCSQLNVDGTAIADVAGCSVVDDLGVSQPLVFDEGDARGAYPGYGVTSFLPNYKSSVATLIPPSTLKLTPVLQVSGGHFTFDGQPHPATAVATGTGGVVLSPSPSITYNGSASAPVDPGTYAVAASFAGNASYTVASGTAQIVIDKATPTIAWSNPADIVYGTPLGTAQLNATASVAGTFTYGPAAGTILPAGAQVLAVTFTPADARYNSATAAVPLNVTQRPITVAADGLTKTYGAADPALTWQLTSGSLVAGDSLSGALSRAPGEDVGSYAITQNTLTAGPNYALTFQGASLVITPATLTVTANDASRLYGTDDPPFTATLSGFVLGDNASVVSGAAACTSSATRLSPVGDYPITCGAGTLSAHNYTFTFAAGTLHVTKAPSQTVLSFDASAAVSGQALTMTATVGPVGTNSGVPCGSVSFADGATPLGTVTLCAGAASLTTASLSVGVHTISVTYGGDGNFFGSSDSSSITVLQHLNVVVGAPLSASGVNRFTAGQTLPFKVQLKDDQGNDVTASTSATTTVRLDVTERDSQTSTYFVDVPETSSGTGDAGGVFVFVSPVLQYNLKTTGYDSGTVSNTRYFSFKLTASDNAYPSVPTGTATLIGESK